MASAKTDTLIHAQSPVARLLPLFFVIFLDSLAYFLVIPVLMHLFLEPQYHMLSAHATQVTRDLWYGAAVALSAFAFIVGSPIIGTLSDRVGRKRTLMLCLFAAVIGYVLPIFGIFYRVPIFILLGRFIAGLSTASQPVAQAAIADFTQGKRKAFYMSMIAFAMTLAMMLGPIMGSTLSNSNIVHWFDVKIPYIVGVMLTVANILLLYCFFYDEEKILVKLHDGAVQRWNSLWRVICKPPVTGLLLIFLLLELAWSQYYQASYLYLAHAYDYSATQIALFTGSIGVWMSIGLTVVYRIVIRYISVERFLWMSYCGVVVGLFGCALPLGPIGQWIFVIPTAIFTGTAYTSLIALISNHTDIEHQGWVLGTASMLLGLAWMSTGFVTGLLIDWFANAANLIAVVVISTGVVLLYKTLQAKA